MGQLRGRHSGGRAFGLSRFVEHTVTRGDDQGALARKLVGLAFPGRVEAEADENTGQGEPNRECEDDQGPRCDAEFAFHDGSPRFLRLSAGPRRG